MLVNIGCQNNSGTCSLARPLAGIQQLTLLTHTIQQLTPDVLSV